MPKSKNILIIKNELNHLGGLEKQTFHITKALSKKGFHITFLSQTKKDVSDPFSYVTLPIKAKFRSRRLLQFDHQCKRWIQNNHQNYPIIFGMDRTSYQTHIRAGNGCHRAYLDRRKLFIDSFFKKLSLHISPMHKALLKIEKFSFEHPHLKKIIVNSHMVKEEILSYYKVDKKKIEVIHNGVEYNEMLFDFSTWQEKKEIFAKEKKLDPKAFQFLFIGNGYHRKGLKQLLLGLSLLKEKNFQLIVIGKEKNKNPFYSLVKKLKLEKKVFFFGYQKNMRAFYQLADCMVIPSFYDPFANVTVEALAFGLYTITSKYNGGSEVITKDNGSIIEDLFSLDSVAEALQKAMQHKKTKKSSYKIRESVKHLDFSNQINKVIETLTHE